MFDDFLQDCEGHEQYLFKNSEPNQIVEGLKVEPQVPKKSSNRGRPRGQKNAVKLKQKEKRVKIVNQNKNIGHWSQEEKRKYHWFLEVHHFHFINKHLRRADKIFKVMENFIGSRQAEQCRSHHQKMQKKFKYFERILIHLRTFYYGTEDSMAVAEDLIKNNIPYDKQLVGSEFLHRQQYSQIKEENKIGEEYIHEHLQQPDSKLIQNMFSDKYQNQMEIRIKKQQFQF